MMLDENGRPMVPVLRCTGESEAQVAASFLRAQGVTVRVNSAVPRSVFPLEVSGLGRVEVLVSEDEADLARRYLDEAGSGS